LISGEGALDVGRNGSVAGYMSGEIVLAFSTTNTSTIGQQMQTLESPTAWNGDMLNKLFQATVESVNESDHFLKTA